MRCTLCEQADFAPGTTVLDSDLAGVHFEVTARALTCPACGEAQVEPDETARLERAIAVRLVDCAPSGEGLRFLRKHVQLRLPDVASVTGVKVEVVSNWETNEHKIPLSAWLVLGSLVLEHYSLPTRTLDRAQRVSEAPTRGVTIRVDLSAE